MFDADAQGHVRDSIAGVTAHAPATEAEARLHLAAAYRLVALMGMDDLIFTHISARVPGEPEHFLLNPYGLGFDEITPASLVKIDHAGRKIGDSPYDANAAGFVIHSAIHMGRPEVDCVMHTHAPASVAIAARPEGLLPLSQFAMRFFNRVALHGYEGLALNLGERERMIADLGQHHTMLLRFHGVLTCGRTIPEAFILAHYFERAAAVQLAAMADGATLPLPPPEVCELTARQFEDQPAPQGEREWPALLRRLDRECPGWRG
ncbi:ribulose-5-phosphate 4-epimerase/fuculose-1-phosphate aldolase [Humitalea rosea]|uniref:Ribulose-5-phosphate 4-epimerase/fuculose-1-phosphate aldolase n=1 Tax=Humitalea rosea TaxID=990373 RepID=A0A2W7KK25_9PROT|nr:class II aldolase/adducin family protein [Humitalea rosea]PZW48399.1 ribulose-5-phosphate 4-epimerase/fuculose-1-phosphate aldolase [Humitalea rosea]